MVEMVQCTTSGQCGYTNMFTSTTVYSYGWGPRQKRLGRLKGRPELIIPKGTRNGIRGRREERDLPELIIS